MSSSANNETRGKILVVDDSTVYLQMLSHLLTRQGYAVSAAEDGPSALTAIGIEPPELIILDIILPGMDGYEVCRRLKEDKRMRDIPVIFLTGLGEQADKVKGLSMGAVDYITKPIQKEEVLARVQTHLTIRKLQKRLSDKLREQRRLNVELEAALAKVKTLSGLIPICANCKKIRDDEGFWQQVEVYVSQHSDADFSHSICPDCKIELYPEFYG